MTTEENETDVQSEADPNKSAKVSNLRRLLDKLSDYIIPPDSKTTESEDGRVKIKNHKDTKENSE